jgi:hypothetical protein
MQANRFLFAEYLLSSEQLFNENTNKTYEDRYFDNYAEAYAWCMA